VGTDMIRNSIYSKPDKKLLSSPFITPIIPLHKHFVIVRCMILTMRAIVLQSY
jgi:hypothetical protein